MTRPMVLAFLLLVLIITSQFEWKQQLVNDIDTSQRTLGKEQHTMKKEEIVKEKIILSQEKMIRRLDKLVHSLQQQLLQCQSVDNTSENYNSNPSTLNTLEVEPQRTLNG
ncbi:unnamed protein product [Spirodela intermedia]|uniref:Uncharacterized protein n=2 Tax=Spirodela intermedia TaxID=51605 RepID=A0ABN7EBP6_SPIIN|nr:unnamed protein product [Spirodela intermedia]CAA7405335.1 unnamed protein product [Spirodela intermedia]